MAKLAPHTAQEILKIMHIDHDYSKWCSFILNSNCLGFRYSDVEQGVTSERVLEKKDSVIGATCRIVLLVRAR